MQAIPATQRPLHITLLYFDDCPSWHDASHLLDRLADDFDQVVLSRRLVDTPEDAAQLHFHGSPSILLNGTDLFATDDDGVGLACRIYQTPDGPAGSPTYRQLVRAIRERTEAAG